MRVRLSIVLFGILLAACGKSDSTKAGVSDDGEATGTGSGKSPPPTGPGPRVVVVGGGLAGTVAAYELEKRGISSHILEATDVWGGRIATADYGDGLHAEYGLQEVWEDNPAVAIAKELKVDFEVETLPAYSSVIIDGKMYPYVQDTLEQYFDTVLTPEEKKTFLEWRKTAAALRETALKEGIPNAEVKKLGRMSFGKWAGEALPKKAAELVRLTIECELATDWNSFSALIGLLEFHVFLGEGMPAYHVVGGNSNLIKALIDAHTGPETLGALVTRIERKKEGDRIKVIVSYMKERQLHTVEAERVVVAVPFWRLHQIQFDPPLSEDKWQGVLTLNRGQYTVVHMIMSKEAKKLWEIDGESPFPVLSDGPLGVIYGPIGDSPESSPNLVFGFLVYGEPAKAYHMVPRELRLDELKKKMDERWPGFTKYIVAQHVYTYHPASIAVWPPGRSPLDERAQALREPEMGLVLAGDYIWSGHSDGASRSGKEAAEKIAAELLK